MFFVWIYVNGAGFVEKQAIIKNSKDVSLRPSKLKVGLILAWMND